MDALDWVCKLLAFPFFIAGMAVIMPWLEFLFWIDDDREMKWKMLHYVKQYFLDIIEGARDYWNDNIPMKD